MADTGAAPESESRASIVYIATLRRNNEARLPMSRVFPTYEAIVTRYGRDDAEKDAIRAIKPDVDARRSDTHVQFEGGARLLYIEKALFHATYDGGSRRKGKTLRRRR